MEARGRDSENMDEEERRRASCLRCQGQVVLRRAGQRGPRPPLIQMHAVKFFTGDLSRRAQLCAVSDCEKLSMGGQVEVVIHLEGGSVRGPPVLTLATFQQTKQPQTNGWSHHIPQIHTERLLWRSYFAQVSKLLWRQRKSCVLFTWASFP